MDIKVTFDNITVKEDKIDTVVKILMLKGEKGDQGDGENNVIEEVQVNGTALPVSNKAVNVQVPTVDNALNSTSENPVQNKVIYNALNGKVNNSDLNNYYQISEVDSLLNNKADTSDVGDIDNLTTTDKTSVVNAVNELNAPEKWVSVGTEEPTDGRRVWFKNSRNLIEPLMATATLNGVTCTNNGDGSFTLNGTATAAATFRIDQSAYTTHDNLKSYNGTYTLSCNELENGLGLGVMQYSTWVSVLVMRNSNTPVTATIDKDNCFIYISIANGKSLNNLTIRPMLQKGSVATGFEPYVKPAIYVDGMKIYEMS